MSLSGVLKQSTAVTVAIGPFPDSADGNTAKTALTIAQADVRLKKNGGNAAQKNNATSCTHDEEGMYDCPFSTTDTNTLGMLTLFVHEAGALMVRHDYMVVPANIWDSWFGSDKQQVDLAEWLGSAPDALSSGKIPADLKLWLATAPLALVSQLIQAQANQLATQAKADVNAEVDGALDTPIPVTPTADSVNERLKRVEEDVTPARAGNLDNLDAAVSSRSTFNSGSDLVVVGALVADAVNAAALAADAANEIADALLKRDIDQVEATAALHSLATGILKSTSRIRNNAGTLEIFRTDGTTVHMKQTITTDPANEPVDELAGGLPGP